MNGMVTVITPTGDRPLAFGLCQRWMLHQTWTPDQWIVVDDGIMPTKPYVPADYIRRAPKSYDPKHTLCLNIKTALPLIRGDKILIMEDDEYYAPEYIAEMSLRLDEYDVVGICHSKYYHVPTGGFKQNLNTGHASLAETGFRTSFLTEFTDYVEKGMNGVWLDTKIWKGLGGPKKFKSLLFVDDDKPLYVGIKGLPGRAGIGIGHRASVYSRKDTPERATLKQWIPHDYQFYLDILSDIWLH